MIRNLQSGCSGQRRYTSISFLRKTPSARVLLERPDARATQSGAAHRCGGYGHREASVERRAQRPSRLGDRPGWCSRTTGTRCGPKCSSCSAMIPSGFGRTRLCDACPILAPSGGSTGRCRLYRSPTGQRHPLSSRYRPHAIPSADRRLRRAPHPERPEDTENDPVPEARPRPRDLLAGHDRCSRLPGDHPSRLNEVS